jgi:hypothetical protein
VTARRPTAVTIVAILAALGGVAGIVGALAGSVIHGLGSLDATETLIVAGGLLMSAVYVALAVGAWSLKPWAWPLGVVAALLSIAYLSAVLARGWSDLMLDAPGLAIVLALVIAVTAIALVSWLRRDVREAFGRR